MENSTGAKSLGLDAIAAEVHRLRAKNDELGRELAAALDRERLLRASLAVAATDHEGVWRWQGDGEDHPESLSCPVVMSASTLREMLATMTPPRVLAAIVGTEDDAEGCFFVALVAADSQPADTPETRIEDAVAVAANGLKALRLLTGGVR